MLRRPLSRLLVCAHRSDELRVQAYNMRSSMLAMNKVNKVSNAAPHHCPSRPVSFAVSPHFSCALSPALVVT